MEERRYFAQIGGERRGPFTLSELADAGVGPQTYVWCKGMEKWRQAAKVADVCRYWRQRLSGTLPEQAPAAPENTPEKRVQMNRENLPPLVRLRTVKSLDPAEPEPDANLDTVPRAYVVEAVLVTLFCMPLTGMIALWFAIRATKWGKTAKTAGNEESARQARRECYFSTRSAKMWIGISFFLGIIVYATLLNVAGR